MSKHSEISWVHSKEAEGRKGLIDLKHWTFLYVPKSWVFARHHHPVLWLRNSGNGLWGQTEYYSLCSTELIWPIVFPLVSTPMIVDYQIFRERVTELIVSNELSWSDWVINTVDSVWADSLSIHFYWASSLCKSVERGLWEVGEGKQPL